MFAVEFQANIQNGFIEIPEEYKHKFQQGKNIKVILLKDEKELERDSIAQLLDRPIEVNEFTPLTRDEIYE